MADCPCTTKLRHECSGNSRAVLVSVILFNLSLLSLLCLASRFPLRNPIANLASSCGISSLRVPPRHWSGSDKVARKTGEDGKTGVTERGPGHGPPPVRIVTDPEGFLFFFLFLFPFFFHPSNAASYNIPIPTGKLTNS